MAQNSARSVGRHFLQIPGPTPLPDRVLRAMDTPIIDHRGPELLPSTPSFGEISPGFFVGTILGLAAPAKTPRPIVERLNREIAKVVNTDAMRERLATMANKAKAGTPEEFTATVAQYVERWSGVIEKLGIAR